MNDHIPTRADRILFWIVTESLTLICVSLCWRATGPAFLFDWKGLKP